MTPRKQQNSKYLHAISPKQKMSGGRFIAETFKGYGVTHVFYMEAIAREALLEMEALGIKRILTHSEKAAAYMADAYARVKQRPGICMAQSVGAANLAAGLQDAFLGLSPVIAITGRQAPMAQYRNAYQEIIHAHMFQGVTKYDVNVDAIEQLPHLLRQAFREATSGKPRPVHLDLLGNLGTLIAEAQAELEVLVEDCFSQCNAFRPEPEKEYIKEAARLLEKAARPVIVAGGGATASCAGPELVKLAEKLSIPVATSLNGKGIIVEDHPLSLGVVGSYSRWCANRVVSEADLVLFVGSHTGDQVTNAWKVPPKETTVIQIDRDAAEIGRNYPNAVGLVGDAKASLRKLVRAVNPGSAKKKKKWARHALGVVDKWRKELEPLRKSDAIPIRPERLCKELTETLPANAILVSDTGYSGIWSGGMVYITHPKQTYLRAAGSLGWAFPASLGAKCAAPDRPVVCFTGDGGFWYHLSELETALRFGINTVTVVNDNFGLGQCRPNVHKVYGSRPGLKEELYKFRQVNFANIAREIGCQGITVDRPEDIAKALKTALSAKAPVVVDVITDLACEAPKPWSPT